MRRILLAAAAVLSMLSCQKASDIPFEEVKYYFFRNDAEIPESPLIESAEQFESLFGAAAFMGKDGRPTPVDFDKEFVIAVVYPVTDVSTELTPESLRREGRELVLSYLETTGEKQTWSMRPVLLVKVDREYMGNDVRLDRRVEDFKNAF